MTIFVVSLTSTLINSEYYFEIVHENLFPDRVSKLLDAKKYIVIASSLNNQSVIIASPLEQLAFLQLLRKLVSRESLNFVIARPNSSQVIPIHMSTNYLPNTC
jgi:hypothetical protein